MKCKHEAITITEYAKDSGMQHSREEGYGWIHGEVRGTLTNKVRVQCDDCDIDKIYYIGKSTPKWLLKAVEEAIEPETREQGTVADIVEFHKQKGSS